MNVEPLPTQTQPSSAPLGKANPMTIHQLHHFLQGIHHKIQEQDKLAAATGENFNVFKILGVEAYEVGTHSAFLSELLSPQGTQPGKHVSQTVSCIITSRKGCRLHPAVERVSC